MSLFPTSLFSHLIKASFRLGVTLQPQGTCSKSKVAVTAVGAGSISCTEVRMLKIPLSVQDSHHPGRDQEEPLFQSLTHLKRPGDSIGLATSTPRLTPHRSLKRQMCLCDSVTESQEDCEHGKTESPMTEATGTRTNGERKKDKACSRYLSLSRDQKGK